VVPAYNYGQTFLALIFVMYPLKEKNDSKYWYRGVQYRGSFNTCLTNNQLIKKIPCQKIEYFKIFFISLHTKKNSLRKKFFFNLKILANNVIILLV
jgi:hypothetical protein